MRKTTLGKKMKNMITADEGKKTNKTKKPLKKIFFYKGYDPTLKQTKT